LNYAVNFKGETQVAMKPEAIKKLPVVMLCITANCNKITAMLNIIQNDSAKRKFLQRCNNLIPPKTHG
jgi:hypothetical protein